MFCTQCGKENKDGAAFCRYCGNKFLPMPDEGMGVFGQTMPNDGMGVYRQVTPNDDIGTYRPQTPDLNNNRMNVSRKNHKKAKKSSSALIVVILVLLVLIGLAGGALIFTMGSGSSSADTGRAENKNESTDNKNSGDDTGKGKNDKSDKNSGKDMSENPDKKSDNKNDGKDEPADTPTPTPTPEEISAAEAAENAYKELLDSMPPANFDDDVTAASFSDAENYAKYGDHIDHFVLKDISGDGVPELFAVTIVNFRWTIVNIYTYKDDRVKLVSSYEDSSPACGFYYSYICEENHYHDRWMGAPIDEMLTEETAYYYDGLTMRETVCGTGYTNKAIDIPNGEYLW